MNLTSKIYVAGHTGLVGSALMRALTARGHTNITTASLSELDLRNQHDVDRFFAHTQPEYVFLAAAKVGGIIANTTRPAEFIYDNLMIETNIIHAAYRHGIKKLLFLGSSCIYPKLCAQPIKEEYLLTGLLEPTNEPYALAKIAGISLCQSYNRQYGTNFISCMPTNLYGPHDNFDLISSHVLPALIAKMIQAQQENAPSVQLWGTGTARREFLYVDDLADACIFLMHHYNDNTPLNIGCGTDISIRELAQLIKDAVGYTGELAYDSSKPDGTPQKLLCVDKINNLGWKHRTSLDEGIVKTITWYQQWLSQQSLAHHSEQYSSGQNSYKKKGHIHEAH
jgi:GDP-L-fucose synthase